ncbi:beta-lactamase family protein [Thermosulfurimonas marina]|uniref:Beta-lactamase family protein n=1 Tax=Thermosulfurimonas marina TaxID=2047767 RepID=A0A6H1WRU8_9BACT|nr:serine hydrolase domain-containing protein [Thermosulfurimonas marina]QJA05947.1 beta-lactamase family protein [Thermosulfurimonas marina]
MRLLPLLDLLKEAVSRGVFPGAVAAIHFQGRDYFFAAGFRALVPEREFNDSGTFYDLASLTKPLSTTLVTLKLLAEGRLGLETPLKGLYPGEFFGEKAYRKVTVRELLAHTAGFPDWRPYYQDLAGLPFAQRRPALLRAILSEPPVYPPARGELYSDLGFFLLGDLLERRAGKKLEALFEEALLEVAPETAGEILFRPLEHGLPREKIAPTEICPFRKRLLRGEVHDENTWVLGGVSGTAGLFGTTRGVLGLLKAFLEVYHGRPRGFLTPELLRTFWDYRHPYGVRALGFDRPSGGASSAGPSWPRKGLGHLGYTGCAFWIAPEETLIAVLLTNRVHPTRKNRLLQGFRPRFFNEVWQAARGKVG